MKNETRSARYENTNGVAISVVASISYHEGELFEWSAYIGGTTRTWHEKDAVEATLSWGDSLRIEDAKHYFPELPIGRYRM